MNFHSDVIQNFKKKVCQQSMSFVKPRYWERKKEGKGRVREKSR